MGGGGGGDRRVPTERRRGRPDRFARSFLLTCLMFSTPRQMANIERGLTPACTCLARRKDGKLAHSRG